LETIYVCVNTVVQAYSISKTTLVITDFNVSRSIIDVSSNIKKIKILLIKNLYVDDSKLTAEVR